MLKTVLTALTFFACFSTSQSQSLPRRVFLGIRMENLTPDSRRIMEIDSTRGVLLAEVFPNSTASAAGMKRGDILLDINGKAVGSTGDVFAQLAGQRPGATFKYSVLRNRKPVQGTASFKAFPEERYPDLDVVYTESSSGIGQQRIIITKPKGTQRLPVVAFIGGVGCYSLDFAMDTTRAEAQFLNTLARSGFLTARLEKPGMGDGAKHCKPCEEVSFKEEMDGYVAAINALKRRPDVDSNAVYVFGHSMGGVFAPLIAGKTSLKGIIAYGTIGSNFQEHLAKTRRTIAAAYGMSPEETDDLIKDFCACSGYYFVDKLSTAEAAKKKTVCGEYLSIFDLRSRAYNDELYAWNIPGLWKSFPGKALLLWGESDFIAAKEDHEILASAVNFYHPGQGTFKSVGKATHGMTTAASFAEARASDETYNPEIAGIVLDWLRPQS